MAAVTVLPPFPAFAELDGTPLNNGYVYIGDAGVDPETNPATVYWDDALGTTAAQPIRTINGYYSNSGSPADVFVNATNFSITVRDSAGALVFTKLNYDLSLPFTTFDYQPSVTGGISRNILGKLDDVVSIKDFGAVGDAVTSDNAAFVLAEALTQNYIYLPAGTYIVTGLTLTKEYFGPGQIELDAVLEPRFFDAVGRDYFTDSGAADAYVLTYTNARVASYIDGQIVRFVADNACTGGACTVNIDGAGSRAIVAANGAAPSAGLIRSSGLTEMFYDESNARFEIMGPVTAYNSSTAGYTYLSNGQVFQWGVSAASSGGSTYSYPIAFTSVHGILGTSNGTVEAIQTTATSVTQFTITSATGAPNVHWWAIGDV